MCDVDLPLVQKLLADGAKPSHRLNGSRTSLHLVALNPHLKYKVADEVVKLLIEAEPEVVEVQDGFGLTALNWAEDYIDVADQHGLKNPNPAALIAISEHMKPGTDGGLKGIKLSQMRPADDVPKTNSYRQIALDQFRRYTYHRDLHGEDPSATVVVPVRPALRFLEGDRVEVRIAEAKHIYTWEEGIVVALHLREAWWPKSHPGVPYEVLLDVGTRMLVLVDRDAVIRREGSGARKTKGAAAKSRFEKKQRDDGQWELVDSITGKARPTSPPDSD
eukprot:gnl/TRDRNA2_/TRDRNA2_173285_c2_seq2.p1 gnl/TRDRNA2_/TRDRNA2_173285_c2~~gnl/TRDRNA2_/TRDRNA2_173285_c2_seq2.p1  ORF type:complete len:316 (+),score=48.30 gnl/TRDRNA2_/TRDRNA2_173285_c2_seq2:122-949(+)